jgi:hypothetical protein
MFHHHTITTMNIDRAVMILAGSFILISLLLAHFHSPYWLWFTAFVGANMIQSAFTGFCPPAMLFRKLGMQGGCAFKGKQG